METSPLTIFFDGACPVCSREIAHYRRKDHAGRLAYIDIADPHFDPLAFGLDPARVRRELHARLPSGEVVAGVPAFIAIWRTLPGWRALARTAANPLFRPLFNLGYRLFTYVRPLLPRRKQLACDSGTCPAR